MPTKIYNERIYGFRILDICRTKIFVLINQPEWLYSRTSTLGVSGLINTHYLLISRHPGFNSHPILLLAFQLVLAKSFTAFDAIDVFAPTVVVTRARLCCELDKPV